MKKVKDLLSKIRINFALLAMTAYLVKILGVSTSYADSIVMLGLCGLYGFGKYLKAKEPKITVDQQMREELKIVKDILSKVNLGKSLNNGKPKRYF